MTGFDLHESEWPHAADADLERNPALATLEEAWRSGLLAELEPSA